MKISKVSSSAVLIMVTILLSACGSQVAGTLVNPPTNLAPIEVPTAEGVVHGRAIYTVSSDQPTAMMKLFQKVFMTNAYAATGSTTVTYNNSGSTTFTINVGSFTPGGFTGTTLSLGSVGVATISDNNLKVCGTGNTKCVTAVIRAYTTGTIAGFVNTAESYGAPVYTGTLNPTSPVGLLAAGSVQVQTISIANNKHTISLSDFPAPTYTVNSDFSNAGAGSYTMTYVLEYALF